MPLWGPRADGKTTKKGGLQREDLARYREREGNFCEEGPGRQEIKRFGYQVRKPTIRKLAKWSPLIREKLRRALLIWYMW